jgi:hypothetical protein
MDIGIGLEDGEGRLRADLILQASAVLARSGGRDKPLVERLRIVRRLGSHTLMVSIIERFSKTIESLEIVIPQDEATPAPNDPTIYYTLLRYSRTVDISFDKLTNISLEDLTMHAVAIIPWLIHWSPNLISLAVEVSHTGEYEFSAYWDPPIYQDGDTQLQSVLFDVDTWTTEEDWPDRIRNILYIILLRSPHLARLRIPKMPILFVSWPRSKSTPLRAIRIISQIEKLNRIVDLQWSIQTMVPKAEDGEVAGAIPVLPNFRRLIIRYGQQFGEGQQISSDPYYDAFGVSCP